MQYYLGLDIGSISTKGVIINEKGEITAGEYIWTQGNPIKAVKDLLIKLKGKLKDEDIEILGAGTTGSARKLIGVMINADVVKNEITAHAVGTLFVYPDVKTILEIGGQDSKIIILEDGIVIDYAMNTLCAAGTGSFLSSQAKRLDIPVEKFGKVALSSDSPVKIAARCTVFAESDLVHKAQIGHKKEDIVAGLCRAVVTNYLNNVGKGKSIKSPIVFQGGVSKNTGVIRAFQTEIGEDILVDKNSHLMGALGAALLAKKQEKHNGFNFNITDISFETKGKECSGCANNCEIICFYKNGKQIDAWGNRCEKGI